MEREATQSMLDEKFPHGSNVVIQNGRGAPFNIARFIVLDDTTIRCNPYGYPAEITFEPKAIEEDGENVIFKGATTVKGYDIVARPAPEAMYERLAEVRPSDEYIEQLVQSRQEAPK